MQTVPPPAVTATAPDPRWTRRRLLRTLGATVIVAGTGAMGYRAYDTAALRPGSGDAYHPWEHWRDDPGLLGAVGLLFGWWSFVAIAS